MAYTKVFAIKSRLDRSVAYAVNEKKTGLAGMVEYAVNRSKTESRLFESAVNCQSPKTAYREMRATKERWHKPGGTLGYHFIQSFAPGEVTPEQAHAIGVEFARRLFGTSHEAVIGTHLDKNHLHNHIVINSVSCVDGRKYHSSPESYYNQVRGVSDQLCREHKLSTITPEGKGKHYAEWNAEQQGKPTIRGMIRQDIDTILADSFTYKTFLELLQKRGYAVKTGPNVVHTAIRPPGSKRFIRLDSLGTGYTESELKARLAEMRTMPQKPERVYTPQFHIARCRGSFTVRRPRKLKGFMALYFKYLYLLRGVKKRAGRQAASFPLKEELLKYDRYVRQFRFLHENRIETAAELSMLHDAVQAEADALADHRKHLYRQRRGGDDSVSGEIDLLTERLRELRRSMGLCRTIQADIPQIEAMSIIGGREAHAQARSVIYEKAHKPRSFDPLIARRGIPPQSSRGD